MRTHTKTAAMSAVVAGGSALALWLAFTGSIALAFMALAGTGVLAVGVIVLITRDVTRGPVKTR
ncbi:hypothetical protein [Nonomuraea sp. NPDC050786]|uniref:hypothetical protein n=1 Tax=Nonomuraea sp. NPDC050786 TaxID=3154840 RepID=UPI0033D47795